ncbi:MAG: hypothetical protein K2X27_16380 [Candidatus Obscuribacterales bacterium]|nr:hypothetical protein [Candidatus Obscuribacterales bacterium]
MDDAVAFLSDCNAAGSDDFGHLSAKLLFDSQFDKGALYAQVSAVSRASSFLPDLQIVGDFDLNRGQAGAELRLGMELAASGNASELFAKAGAASSPEAAGALGNKPGDKPEDKPDENKESKIGKTEPGTIRNSDGSEVDYIRAADGQIRPAFVRRPNGTGTKFEYDSKGQLSELTHVENARGGERVVSKQRSQDGLHWQQVIPENRSGHTGKFLIRENGDFSFEELKTSWNKEPRVFTYEASGNRSIKGADGSPIYESKRHDDGSVTDTWYANGKISNERCLFPDGSSTFKSADGKFFKYDPQERVTLRHTVNSDGSFVDLERQPNGMMLPTKVHCADGSERIYKYNSKGAIVEIKNTNRNGELVNRYTSLDGRHFSKTEGRGPDGFDGIVTVTPDGIETFASRTRDGQTVYYARDLKGPGSKRVGR